MGTESTQTPTQNGAGIGTTTADPAAPGDHTLAPFPTESTETAGLLGGVRSDAKKLLDRLYLRLEETGIDFYLSAMHASFGWPLRFLSWRFFRYARVDPAAVARIKEVAAQGE